ncbi:unnamed protein product [Prorocentrum cordatum]|uniref:Uncharacterized protein n=1 Tax=Prorocentrum cordatum TaxID=2364126 RepID=A0ABN9Y7B4_9DINO|nr:unnamed protein product [Polarella glacialis]
MAYNAAAQCTISNRVQAMAVAIPALLVTVVAGPVAWVWILRLDSAKRRYDAAAGGGEDKSHSCDDEDKDDDRKDKDNNDDNNEVGRDKDKDDEYQGDEGKEKGANDDKADVDKDSDNDDDGKDQDKPKDEDNNEVGKQDNSLRFLTGSYQERYNYLTLGGMPPEQVHGARRDLCDVAGILLPGPEAGSCPRGDGPLPPRAQRVSPVREQRAEPRRTESARGVGPRHGGCGVARG